MASFAAYSSDGDYVVDALGSPHLNFGSVSDLDLRRLLDPTAEALRRRVEQDLKRHRLLVFRGQTQLSGEDHVALSALFGSLDHGLHRPHPKAPHPQLLRVSNDEAQGFRSIGTSGWHVDGVMIRWPFHLQTMHFLHATEAGVTRFLGFEELLADLEPSVRHRWERLWFVAGVGDDLRNGQGQVAMHPLVTRLGPERRGMCMHLGEGYSLGFVEEEPQAATPAAETKDAAETEDEAEPGDSDAREEAAPAGLFGRLFAAAGTSGTGGTPAPRKSDNVFDAEEELARLLGCDRTAIVSPGPILQEMRDAIDKRTELCVHDQSWRDGDFAFIDNRALAHLPAAGTQNPSDTDGLRLFHRTTMTNGTPLVSANRERPSMVMSSGAVPLPEGSGGVDVRDSFVYRRVLRGLLEAQQNQQKAEAAK